MAAECAFILSSGKHCRCVATRNQRFCRHHGRASAPRPPQPHLYSSLAHWRNLGRTVHTLPIEEIPAEAFWILEALLDTGSAGISDRVAGRLLRALFRRYGSVPFDLPGRRSEATPSPQPPPPPVPAAGASPSLPMDPDFGIGRLTEMLERYASGADPRSARNPF